MWRNAQSLRELVEGEEEERRTATNGRTKRNATSTGDDDERHAITEGEIQRADEREPSVDEEVKWYERFQELRARSTRARLVLSIGLIVVNVLVAVYVLLMYFFASPASGVSSSRNGGSNYACSLWRTAGIVTVLNGIPVLTAINLLTKTNR